MKKLFLILLVILLVGCYTMLPQETKSPQESLLLQMLDTSLSYDVVSRRVDDLENTYNVHSLILYNDLIFKIDVSKTDFADETVIYGIAIIYSADDWIFMNGEVMIKTDGNLYKHEDENPYHKVGSGYVLEILMINVPKEELIEMANSESLRIQVRFDPLTITPEGIELLRRFCTEYVE